MIKTATLPLSFLFQIPAAQTSRTWTFFIPFARIPSIAKLIAPQLAKARALSLEFFSPEEPRNFRGGSVQGKFSGTPRDKGIGVTAILVTGDSTCVPRFAQLHPNLESEFLVCQFRVSRP